MNQELPSEAVDFDAIVKIGFGGLGCKVVFQNEFWLNVQTTLECPKPEKDGTKYATITFRLKQASEIKS